tara:strand:+ start:43398 stop:43604 length:207 start_codon:yes stop_codon:yes gene_type:complete
MGPTITKAEAFGAAHSPNRHAHTKHNRFMLPNPNTGIVTGCAPVNTATAKHRGLMGPTLLPFDYGPCF